MTIETKTNLKTFPVLSIDAWGNPEDGYEWNQWFHVGTIELNLDAENREIIQAMVNAGYLTPKGLDVATVEDDGYNLVIIDKETGEPAFAIEYGPTI